MRMVECKHCNESNDSRLWVKGVCPNCSKHKDYFTPDNSAPAPHNSATAPRVGSGVDFIPDWMHPYTAAAAEESLTGFEFKGTGWYVTKTDTLLVVPVDLPSVETEVWQQNWPADQLFLFMVYNGRNPCHAFNMVVNAPVRQHTK